VLFSIGKACRAAGNRVIYFAGYKKGEDFYKRDEIEAAADIVVFSVDRGEAIPAVRPQDRSFVGNILESITAYAEGKLGPRPIDLKAVSRIIVIGSDRMMSAVSAARHGALAKYLSPNHVGIASINSPMVHDEGSLRPVPPEAGIPPPGPRRRSSSPVSTRPADGRDDWDTSGPTSPEHRRQKPREAGSSILAEGVRGCRPGADDTSSHTGRDRASVGLNVRSGSLAAAG
jgi:hypothetical protein